jgi:hypothetical protein
MLHLLPTRNLSALGKMIEQFIGGDENLSGWVDILDFAVLVINCTTPKIENRFSDGRPIEGLVVKMLGDMSRLTDQIRVLETLVTRM